MPRASTTFRQAQVTRAIKGAKAAGMDVKRVEIDREGRIVLSSIATVDAGSDLDKWLGWLTNIGPQPLPNGGVGQPSDYCGIS